MSCNSSSSMWQKRQWRSSILRFSYLPVSTRIGATPHLNLQNAALCRGGKTISKYFSVVNPSWKPTGPQFVSTSTWSTNCVINRQNLSAKYFSIVNNSTWQSQHLTLFLKRILIDLLENKDLIRYFRKQWTYRNTI